ncbi:MAG: glutaminyl-peptide cyclotransferase [Pseudomonadales bacterium]
MIIKHRFLFIIFLFSLPLQFSAASSHAATIQCDKLSADTIPTTWIVRVNNTYPHNSSAFSQGLIYHDGHLFESTGHYGQSTVSKIHLKSGKNIKQIALDDTVFGEGLTIWQDQIIQLTWKAGQVYRYSLADLVLEQTQRISGEGWGITHDHQHLITSDGTAQLSFRDPTSLAVQSTIDVTYLGRPLKNLNELEWVNNCLLANIWQSQYIAIIDPASGQTTALIDLSRIIAHEQKTGTSEVANGIAWLADNQRLLITGKYWQRIYEIELIERSTAKP